MNITQFKVSTMHLNLLLMSIENNYNLQIFLNYKKTTKFNVIINLTKSIESNSDIKRSFFCLEYVFIDTMMSFLSSCEVMA